MVQAKQLESHLATQARLATFVFPPVMMLWLGDVMPVMPGSGLGRGAEPDWSLKVKLWSLIGWPGLTTHRVVVISPGHRDTGSVPCQQHCRVETLCCVTLTIRCIPCVPSPWTGVSSQHTLLMVKRWYNKWRHQLVLTRFSSRTEKDILDSGWSTKIARAKSPRAASSWSQQTSSVREGEAEASSGLRLTTESSTSNKVFSAS